MCAYPDPLPETHLFFIWPNQPSSNVCKKIIVQILFVMLQLRYAVLRGQNGYML